MGEPSQFRRGEWEPKYPDFAAPTEGPLNDEASDQSRGGPWTEAPPDSHVARFRLTDARENSFLRKFGRGSVVGSGGTGHRDTGQSQLVVVFKATRYAPETQYTYYFADHDQGKRVFDAMAAAEHPGEVVHAMLIRESVPYTKDAGRSY